MPEEAKFWGNGEVEGWGGEGEAGKGLLGGGDKSRADCDRGKMLYRGTVFESLSRSLSVHGRPSVSHYQWRRDMRAHAHTHAPLQHFSKRHALLVRSHCEAWLKYGGGQDHGKAEVLPHLQACCGLSPFPLRGKCCDLLERGSSGLFVCAPACMWGDRQKE